MPENQTTLGTASAADLARNFRIAAVVILVIGLVAAGLVYGLSARPDSLDDLNTPDNNKRAARDVASNFGQWGAFSYNLSEELKDPAIKAGIIAGATILLAGACFYIAHLNGRDT